ncbi:MAG: DNA polymerase III subunit delta [Gammaproteobacteria bacterium]|nr:DNA polymerase III subunit delta [Gammaproteobacteria bacterium]
MQIKANQLREHLKKGIQSLYFIYGDEPLQHRDYTDMVRKAAKYYDYDESERYSADNQFNWQEIQQSASSIGLFSSKKLIDLHLSSGKPGDKGAKFLVDYCEQIPEDTILLIHCGKFEGASKKTKWFKALDKTGVMVPLYPLKGHELSHWVQQRCYREGIQLETESLNVFLEHIEGNLLSADQEIIKLALLFKAADTENSQNITTISHQQLIDSINDSALYNPFELFDTALNGQSKLVLQMLKQFEQDGTALVYLLFLISKEIRLMATLSEYAKQMSIIQAMQKEYIFNNRKGLIQKVLSNAPAINWEDYLLILADIDKISKGVATNTKVISHPWNQLSQLLLEIAQSVR